MKVNFRTLALVLLVVVGLPVAGYFLSKQTQPYKHAARFDCLDFDADDVTISNTCDETLLARLCTAPTDEADLSCDYFTLAPGETSPAPGGPTPRSVDYQACKAPYVPAKVSQQDKPNIYERGCLPEDGERAPVIDRAWMKH
ncbi:hypothetical protein WNY37_17330 [Henriciella sp. AS95]|uniref:hypothetical protein n=1 Tax=Henriciella sp. AS95 TaxID=3135782 RepID=UPI003175F3A5